MEKQGYRTPAQARVSGATHHPSVACRIYHDKNTKIELLLSI